MGLQQRFRFEQEPGRPTTEEIEKLWLRALGFTLKKTEAILAKEDEEVSNRQKASITKIVMAISDLKQAIEESKFTAGESEEDVSAWGEEIECKMPEADVKVNQLNQQIQRLGASRLKKRNIRDNSPGNNMEETNKWNSSASCLPRN